MLEGEVRTAETLVFDDPYEHVVVSAMEKDRHGATWVWTIGSRLRSRWKMPIAILRREARRPTPEELPHGQ